MKPNKLLVAAACAIALGGAANAEVMNKTALLPNFDLANVESVLNEMGVSHARDQLAGGAVIVATIDEGAMPIKIVFAPRACDNGPCVGLMMLGFFQGADLTQNNEYTRRMNPTAAFAEGQVTLLKRYLIGDHGYTRGTFEVDVVVFYSAIKQFIDYRSTGGTSNMISFEQVNLPTDTPANVAPGKPMPGDDLANALNAQQKIGNVGATSSAPSKFAAQNRHGEILNVSVVNVSMPELGYTFAVPELDFERFYSAPKSE
jgi:hypothetical protein